MQKLQIKIHVHVFVFTYQITSVTEIADIAVTESLSNVVLEADINQSALRNVKTLSEFKG